MRLMRLALGLSLFLLVAPRPALAQDDVATVRLDGQAVFQVGPTSDARVGVRCALPLPSAH